MSSLETDLIHRRLRNQHLVKASLRDPAEIVGWLGAVQSQDYFGAKWGLGLRARGLSDADVDRAFDAGAILRTHVLRPTWHFVTPRDIRWMLALTAPRVHQAMAYHQRYCELDGRTIARGRAAIARALEGGRVLTRTEIAAVLDRAGIEASGHRLAHIVMKAELDAVICSGPRRGKQFTYALLDERAPDAMTLARDEALAELTRRYFTSHGPATVRDYAWWSGLSIRDARAGIASVTPALLQETIDDRTYWFVESSARTRAATSSASTAWLLPNYDEYMIAYKDRDPVVHLSQAASGKGFGSEIFSHLLVIDGLLAGTWRRTPNKGDIVVKVTTYTKLSRVAKEAVAAAAERYGRFVNQPVSLSTTV
jgi:DNA glycosylase AlkZ-like